MTISCVVPAQNEGAGLRVLISEILEVPQISEIIISEGGSSDNTWQVALEIATNNSKFVKCIRQSGKGKFNAVLEALEISSFEFILIWDADATVPASSNLKLIQALDENPALIVGNRLNGLRHRHSIPFLNLLGNWFFSILWIPLIPWKPIDLFCGAKLFPRSLVSNLNPSFLEHDSYGDLSLVLCAKNSGIRIKSIPVEYKERVFGDSKMNPWKSGLQFLVFSFFAYKETFFKR